MISVSNLSKSFGERVLFRDVTFQLGPAERYGLVGANGSGKTTLLGILAGSIDPTDGQVSVPRDLRVGVLKQDAFLYDEETILSVALMGDRELWEAMREKEAILARAEEDFDADRFSELEETVQRLDGYTVEARAAAVLEGLGLPAEIHQRPLSTLSGGFKLRVLLAQVLASAPDVLLLDEPTNHLDILSIRWLEKFLREFEGAVVVISHDHRFLDQVSTKILDVDYETVLEYPGNYSDFLQAKQEERERREKEIVAREKEIAHHQKFVDRFRAKASKARQAQSKLRLIEKKAASLEELPPSSRRYPAFDFQQRRPSGREVLKVAGVRKSYGEHEVLHGVDLEIRRGDRLSILGPNGIGKSTLLKIVVGALEADRGKVEWGYETHVGYFAQDHEEQFEDQDQTAQDWVWDACPGKDVGFVRGQMGRVLFSGDDGLKPVARLSGGEAARLVFCRLALQRPNVLVLDEPTNHLDLESIEALVQALRAYDGTLVFVSHDRWFVSRLASRVVEITADGVRDYPGTYKEYVHASGDDHLDSDQVVLKARERKRRDKAESREAWKARKSRGDDGKKRERKMRKLAERMEEATARIERAEARLAEIDQTFAQPTYYESTDPDEVVRLEKERSEVEEEMAGFMETWEDTGRRLERLEREAGEDDG